MTEREELLTTLILALCDRIDDSITARSEPHLMLAAQQARQMVRENK